MKLIVPQKPKAVGRIAPPKSFTSNPQKEVCDTSKPSASEASKRGRRSRNKGASFERVIAKKFEAVYGEKFVRTPQSGGFAKNNAKAGDFRGDIVPADAGVNSVLHVECKNAQSWSLPAWLRQAMSDCPEGKIPVVIFHQHNTSQDFIALSLEDFFNLVPHDAVIRGDT